MASVVNTPKPRSLKGLSEKHICILGLLSDEGWHHAKGLESLAGPGYRKCVEELQKRGFPIKRGPMGITKKSPTGGPGYMLKDEVIEEKDKPKGDK